MTQRKIINTEASLHGCLNFANETDPWGTALQGWKQEEETSKATEKKGSE